MKFPRYSVNINLDAMKHNLDIVRKLRPKSKILGIVKSNAYGHSISRVISVLRECDGLGISDFSEALLLREFGYSKKIILLNGFNCPNELKACKEHNFIPVVHSERQIDQLKKCNLAKNMNVWLKIDSGMNRLGFSINSAISAINTVRKIDNLNIEVLMTHWHSANLTDKSFTKSQYSNFINIANQYSLPVSMSNSAGILAWDYADDWVRPGMMLYGVSPIKNKLADELSLKPVMELSSSIISIKECKKGEYIGYGATYKCPKDMLIGIIPIGYGDGYPRTNSGAPIIVKDTQTTILGVASMEKLVVDLSIIDSPQINDKAILWGNELSIESVASFTGRSPYELLCQVRQ